jgi:hypothetical protein
MVLDRGGPAAGLLVVVACLLAAVLVPFGWWRPEVVGPVLILAVLPVLWLVRRLPSVTTRQVPAGAAVACLLLVAGFTAWAGLTHGEHLVLRRDAGAYALFGQWLASRHGLPVAGDLQSFGGLAATHVPGLSLSSPAFYQTGTAGADGTVWQVTPQFLLGAPALYSIGWWLAGWTGMFWTPALLSGMGILAFAGLAIRLLGPRWAVPATALLVLSQPMLHTARATYSEPASMLLLLTGAVLAVDAVAARYGARARRLGLTAGLVMGLAGLVRVDVLREVALLIPVCAVLALRRNAAGVPLGAGALLGVLVSAVPGWMLSRPYLQALWPDSLRPLALVTAALVVVSVAVVGFARRPVGWRKALGRGKALGRRKALGRVPRGWTVAAGSLVLVAGLVLASRPLWSVQRQCIDDPSQDMIEALQAQQGLPVDGLRTYGEQSVRWVTWFVGPVAVIAALLAFAVLAAAAVRWWHGSRIRDPVGDRARRRLAGAGVPPWLVPGAVGLGSVLITLYRPEITPDHPWADRRLTTVVLPAVALAAMATAARVVRLARGRLGTRRATFVHGGLMLVLLIPPAAATAPLATSRTEVGEPAAVAQVCSALRPGDVVAMVSDDVGGTRAQNEWVQVVRGVCGHPSVALSGSADQQKEAVNALGPLARDAGHRLVLLVAAESDAHAEAALTALGAAPQRAAMLVTREDERLLTHRADATVPLTVDVWLAPWPG